MVTLLRKYFSEIEHFYLWGLLIYLMMKRGDFPLFLFLQPNCRYYFRILDSRNQAKKELGWQSRRVLASFGLPYMQTDKQNRTLILKDGRKLGFAEYGEPAGEPVFHFHGSGGSRLEYPSPENILTRLSIRFISVDRPGNGLSDYQANRRLLDWAKDVSELADHLGIEQFYVDGHSAGGPHALACAHQLPERVVAGAAISSVAPMSRPNAYKGMPLLNQLLAKSARHIPLITKMFRWMMRKMIIGDFEKSSKQLMASIPASDKKVLYNSPNAESFISAVREGFRFGSRGVAQDDTLINRDWGFDLACIKPRIDIWHGEADVNVPIGAAKYLCEMLPHTHATFLPDEGHFFLLKYWEKILSALVYERKAAVLF